MRQAGPQKLLTNLVSLLRYALGQAETLEPFPDVVRERFQAWLAEQEAAGRVFTSDQMAWLELIRDQIGASLAVSPESFDLAPFFQRGGVARAYQLFGDELEDLVTEMNEVLVA